MGSSNDQRSDSMNPNNDAYWESRGYDEQPDNWEDLVANGEVESQHDDNHANQLNPEHPEFAHSRGESIDEDE